MTKTLAFWTLAAVAMWSATLGGCAAKPQPMLLPAAQLAENQLTVFWKASLQLNERTRETVRCLYRTPNRIIAMTSDNRLLALDAFSGRFVWSAELGSPDLEPTGLDQVGQAVFVGLLDKLFIFSAEDGSLVARRDLKRAPSTRPVVSPEYVYYGTHQGWLQALAMFAGRDSWQRLTHASITAAPVFDAERLYFANTDGRVFAASAVSREPAWEFQTNAAVVADLKLTGQGLVLVASRDYVLYALNPVTGEVAWMATTGDPLEKAPQVRGGRVFVVKRDGALMAFEEVTGARLWTAEGVDRTLCAGPTTLFVLRPSGTISALSVASGQEKYRLGPGLVTVVATNDIDGQLFIADRHGRVEAVHEAKVRYYLPAGSAAPEAEVAE